MHIARLTIMIWRWRKDAKMMNSTKMLKNKSKIRLKIKQKTIQTLANIKVVEDKTNEVIDDE